MRNALINSENHKVALAVESVADFIARAIEVIADVLSRGGQLIYSGAGTSGRLAVDEPVMGCLEMAAKKLTDLTA